MSFLKKLLPSPALHGAVKKADLALVRQLVQTDKVDEQDSKGNTPLHLAAQLGRDAIARELCARLASAATLNDDGNNPLHLACVQGSRQVVAVLLGDTNKKDNAEAKRKLINTKNKAGLTPLMLATAASNLEAARALVQFGADLNATTSEGYTAFTLAVRKGDLYALAELRNLGAQVDSPRLSNGYSPLHIAAAEGQAVSARWLVENGANLESRDNDGKTPKELARDLGHNSLHALLRDLEFGRAGISLAEGASSAATTAAVGTPATPEGLVGGGAAIGVSPATVPITLYDELRAEAERPGELYPVLG